MILRGLEVPCFVVFWSAAAAHWSLPSPRAARYSRVLLLSQLAWHVVDGRFLVRLRVAVWRGCQIVWLRFAIDDQSLRICADLFLRLLVSLWCCFVENLILEIFGICNTSLVPGRLIWEFLCVFFVMKLFGGTSGNLTWTWKIPRKLYLLGGFPASYVWWHQRVRPQIIPKGLMSLWLSLNKWD